LDLKRVEPTTVLLVRHGETDWNLEKRFQGLIDTRLNSAGHEQSKQLAKAVQRQNIAAVWTSPLQRAQATGSAIAMSLGLEVCLEERLRERNLGLMQGLISQEVKEKYPHFWKAWTTTGLPFPPEAGVELGPAAVARIESVLFDLAEKFPGRTVVVVTHGALIRLLLHRAVGTASITTLVVGPSRSWRLEKFNDASHLGGLRGFGFFSDSDPEEWGGIKSTTTVLVCRHGETNWNLVRRFQGMEDIPLNAAGCEQALLLAETLKSEGICAIWSSPLLRARETGMAIAGACRLNLQVDDRLRERNLGVLQGRNPTEVHEQYPDVIAAWRAQVPLPPESNAEPSEEVVERVESALFDLAESYPGKKVALVLHGATIRCLLKRAVGMKRIETPKNVSLTSIIVGPGRGWHLSQVHETSHMPKLNYDESLLMEHANASLVARL
jgi:probable phosphoglycerate mutase